MAAFEFNQENELAQIQIELLEKRYQPGPYNSFYVHDPKQRLISAAPFRDRVVHHALCRVIEPIFEVRFIHDSYACRVGKGTAEPPAFAAEMPKVGEDILWQK